MGATALDGAKVYSTPLRDGNSFACSTCHSLSEPSPDGVRRPGHQLGDATRRSSWKNGKAHTFLDAANSCVTEWMVGSAWTASDPRYLALHDYLDAQAKVAQAPNVTFEIASPPTDLSGGDVTRGRSLFNQSCMVCHGADALGTVRGPSIAGSKREPAYVAARIRTSGSSTSPIYQGLSGGVMPFWAKDRLSDAEVRDLVAFVTSPVSAGGAGGQGGASAGGGAGGLLGNGSGGIGGSSGNDAGSGAGGNSGAATGGIGGTSGGAGTTASGGASGGGSGCTSSDPHVGWIADLGINTGEGQVSGKAVIVDDCTLELRDFSYDGNGIDVRVYGAKTQDFKDGFIMGDDLLGKVFKKQTLRVKLPADKTLNDLSWVGIWCIPAKANFGSGQFKAP
jgi:mono/diheme cytochrome c family protein